MSNARSGDRLTKNERREAAREKARILREEQRKREKRNKIFLQGGIALAAIAIVAIVAVIIVNAIRPPGPGPRNMLADGIKIGQDLVAERTPALEADDEPVANPRTEDVLDIQIWVDYQCPICKAFEEANTTQLEELINNGNATVEIHPLSFLDRTSLGARYSSRSANAAACVADYSPDSFWAWNSLMFDNQPAEGTTGLTNEELIDIAEQAEVESLDDITSCINDEEFKGWVENASNRAQNVPVEGAEDENLVIQGTPTVLVNGVRYNPQLNQDGSFSPEDFANFILTVAGNEFTEESTSTPTPTPEPES